MAQDTDSDKVYSIGEVSEITGVEQYMLRQWEKHFTALDPKKHVSSNKRLYTEKHIKIIRRIIVLREHEHMTYRGANTKINDELGQKDTPTDLHGMLALADKIADEARAIINLFDSNNSQEPLEAEELTEE